jgi:hypothetical protein
MQNEKTVTKEKMLPNHACLSLGRYVCGDAGGGGGGNHELLCDRYKCAGCQFGGRPNISWNRS